jgi:hypothetical protein
MSSLGINPVSPRATTVTPVLPQTPAGKLTALCKPRACGVAVIAITFVAFAFTASAAWAQALCANEQLRAEQPYGLRLPDCRAYEMVSPPEKDDYDAVSSIFDAARASLSGEALTWESEGSFGDPEGHEFLNQYIARREPGLDRWSTQPISPPYTAYSTSTINNAYGTLSFTPELTEGIAETDMPLTGEALPEYENLYLADLTSFPISYRLVTNGAPYGEPRHQIIDPPEVAGVSTDLSHVVYTELERVSEWVNGTLKLASVAPGNAKPLESAEAGGDPQPGRYAGIGRNDLWRSVSADGSQVFFTYPSTNGDGTLDRQLYVREDGANTVEVSKSQRTPEDPVGRQSARFWGANVGGSRVFFTSCAKLTNDATASAQAEGATACFPGEPEAGNDLYEYDLETGVLTDLTVDRLTAEKLGDPLGAKVLGVVDISEDGSYVYFVAEGTLTTGRNAEGGEPISEKPNLYVSHLENGAWTTRFIATLAPPTDYIGGGNGQEGGDSEDWSSSPALNSVRETPDGTHLAFLSSESLTGYNNLPTEPDDCTEKEVPAPCREIFSYDAVTGKLVCVSCNPNGARPIGSSSWEQRQTVPYALEGYTPRNYSENGGRLFFDSKDALVPHDSNGRQDVYEWEQDGEGSCEQASGCIFPISDVAGNYESFFLDASPSGNDVFFATEDQLVPADTDSHVDVYDARVDGGFPVSTEPPSCDNGDSCKGPVSPQLGVFGAPASATFSGAGNLAPASPPVSLSLVSPKPAPKPLTRAEKLAKALKVCRGERSAKRREGCERAAQKRYGPVKAKRSVKR